MTDSGRKRLVSDLHTLLVLLVLLGGCGDQKHEAPAPSVVENSEVKEKPPRKYKYEAGQLYVEIAGSLLVVPEKCLGVRSGDPSTGFHITVYWFGGEVICESDAAMTHAERNRGRITMRVEPWIGEGTGTVADHRARIASDALRMFDTRIQDAFENAELEMWQLRTDMPVYLRPESAQPTFERHLPVLLNCDWSADKCGSWGLLVDGVRYGYTFDKGIEREWIEIDERLAKFTRSLVQAEYR